MDIFKEFVSTYGVTIMYAILTAIAGFIGNAVKRLYQKHVTDKTKKDVIRTCVLAAEQLYKDMHGEEKYNRAVEAATQILTEKGIEISELEIKMLIEAAVSEFNNAFGQYDNEAMPTCTNAIGFYTIDSDPDPDEDEDPESEDE